MMKFHGIFAAILIVVSNVGLAAENWPEFRGPEGDGIARQAKLPLKINADRHVRWSTPIHGRGWSSPVVWGNQIWLTTATEDGTEMSVVCVDRRTGEIVHDRVLLKNNEPDFCHPQNSYATPTPTLDAERVVVHFGSYGTFALNPATAETIWERRDLPCNHHRGPASSPILYDNLVIVAFDGFDVQYVVALDKETGNTVWRQSRQIDYDTDNGDLKKAYCTGKVIHVDGADQLIYPGAVGTEAYDPVTGNRLWHVYHAGMNASARPVFGEGLLYITNGMGAMVAVRPGGSGDITESNIAWKTNKTVAKKSSQVVWDGLLYMVSDQGVASCREGKTGEVLWQERLGGEYAASPVLAGEHLYFFGTEGTITVVRLGRDFRRVSSTVLGDGFMASPAIVDNMMILRSKSHLYAIAE